MGPGRVKCAGCRRPVGWAYRFPVVLWCSEQCHSDYQVTGNEERDAVVEQAVGRLSTIKLAEVLGVSRQRISQIATKRKLVD